MTEFNFLYKINGKVKPGSHRGKDLGFPTVNLDYVEEVELGVYASYVLFDNRLYESISNVGSAITFGQNELKIETYIFDFARQIYDQEIVVFLVQKIRDIQKFKSTQELVAQIQRDIDLAEKILKTSCLDIF